MALGQHVVAQPTSPIDRLMQQDVRLAAVAERLLGANRQLCRQEMPLIGMIWHSRDQYRAELAGNAFANGTIAVEAVLPGSAAAAAGVQAGDGIVAIGDRRTATMTRVGEAPLRDTAFAALADQAGRRPLALTIMRDGVLRVLSLEVPEGCRALVEIRSANPLDARSDGKVIQVNYGLAVAASDAELAVIFAHELGHLVLEHRRRLEAAGVEKGFFGEFGRNQQLNRQVEVEADRISVHLLANAGYDPAIAPAFWRSKLGRRAGGGILRSSTYPSAEARAGQLEREIAEYMGGAVGPSYPGHLLARRDVPFD
jgi:Zn-dependent protease with chaperone function